MACHHIALACGSARTVHVSDIYTLRYSAPRRAKSGRDTAGASRRAVPKRPRGKAPVLITQSASPKALAAMDTQHPSNELLVQRCSPSYLPKSLTAPSAHANTKAISAPKRDGLVCEPADHTGVARPLPPTERCDGDVTLPRSTFTLPPPRAYCATLHLACSKTKACCSNHITQARSQARRLAISFCIDSKRHHVQ